MSSRRRVVKGTSKAAAVAGDAGTAAWDLSTLLPLPSGSKWACAKAGQKAEGTPPLLPLYRNESRENRASAGGRAAGCRADGRREADGQSTDGRRAGGGECSCWAKYTSWTSWTGSTKHTSCGRCAGYWAYGWADGRTDGEGLGARRGRIPETFSAGGQHSLAGDDGRLLLSVCGGLCAGGVAKQAEPPHWPV